MDDDVLGEKSKRHPGKKRALELYTIASLMKTESGRDLMWRFLEQTGIFRNVFDVDPIIHAKNAGRRESGLWMEQELREASPDSYYQMLKEHDDAR